MAAKKRPPRQVWFLHAGDGLVGIPFFSKGKAIEARSLATFEDETGQGVRYDIVGPYVLAERVRQK